MATGRLSQRDTPQRVVGAQARVGRTLKKKWQLVRLIGLGGTGAVYEATHRNGARVAIKIIHADLSRDPQHCMRFLREGDATNAIDHPGVVFIHDDDVDDDGSMFLVMELLEGESLQAKLDAASDGLPCEAVLSWAESLLEVLSASHDAGILHRDLKPSNLFLTRSGELKVLDFGLASRVVVRGVAPYSTQSGILLGTPAFMSPEQARARWDLVDTRSDLWAAGATLFTLLSGQHVHLGTTPQEQLGMAMTVSPRSLRSANSALPVGVIRWVDRALAFEPSVRFQSAREMLMQGKRLQTSANVPTLDERPQQGATASERESNQPAWITPIEHSLAEQRRFRRLIVALTAGVAVFGASSVAVQRCSRYESARPDASGSNAGRALRNGTPATARLPSIERPSESAGSGSSRPRVANQSAASVPVPARQRHPSRSVPTVRIPEPPLKEPSQPERIPLLERVELQDRK